MEPDASVEAPPPGPDLFQHAMRELQRVVLEIPDARSRLAYVGELTEDAALKVLNLVETAQPDCGARAQQAQRLAESLARSAGSASLNIDHARRVLALCSTFAGDMASFAESQSKVLSDIMLAQDFQDLSGQVIGKVCDMMSRTERELERLMRDDGGPLATTAESPALADVLQGPQTPDKALAQGDVDDLLASLGF
jgi:chemotaxis protein CheZ